mmetsp:Transcript_10985/g.19723  ORF Transcript_10985/g.19723 Transcript_10985/m.19723 type:complete len:206 (+) Transcript_10985:841-1458(+)
MRRGWTMHSPGGDSARHSRHHDGICAGRSQSPIRRRGGPVAGRDGEICRDCFGRCGRFSGGSHVSIHRTAILRIYISRHSACVMIWYIDCYISTLSLSLSLLEQKNSFPLLSNGALLSHALIAAVRPLLPLATSSLVAPLMVMSFMASTLTSITRTPLATVLILALSSSGMTPLSVLLPGVMMASYVSVWVSDRLSSDSFFSYSE